MLKMCYYLTYKLDTEIFCFDSISTCYVSLNCLGRVIISGAEDGLLAISSPSTGLTVRLLNDHKGASIACLHVSSVKVK